MWPPPSTIASETVAGRRRLNESAARWEGLQCRVPAVQVAEKYFWIDGFATGERSSFRCSARRNATAEAAMRTPTRRVAMRTLTTGGDCRSPPVESVVLEGAQELHAGEGEHAGDGAAQSPLGQPVREVRSDQDARDRDDPNRG